jgi:hypothetical protein
MCLRFFIFLNLFLINPIVKTEIGKLVENSLLGIFL